MVYPYLVYQSLHDIGRRGNLDKTAAARTQLSQRDSQGSVQGHVEDGHLLHLELSRRAVV